MPDAIGETIRARREKLGWSQRELAHRAGLNCPWPVNQQTIQRIESGETSYSRTLPAILAALSLDDKLLVPDQPRSNGEDRPIYPEIPVIAITDIDGDGLFELTGVPVGFVPRPAALGGAPGVYAIYMRGADMVPMYRSGDLLVIDPNRPPRPEDGALFLSRARDKVRVAEYVVETPTEWRCKKWGDKPAELALSKRDFPLCECVYAIRKRP